MNRLNWCAGAHGRSLTMQRSRATFVSSLERGVSGSPLRSIEKSSNSFVVESPQVPSFKRNKNIRNENQTTSKQVESGIGEDFSALLAASRPDAGAEHGSI
jgi:hypothetical protein